MRTLSLILGVLAAVCVSSAATCWTSGCNLHTWAVVGCPSNHIEKSRTECTGGFIYECCESVGGGGDTGGGDTGGGDSESGGNDVAEITFEAFVGAVTSNGYADPGREKYDAFIASAPSKGSITSKVEAAMALAQLLHESGGLKYKREIACEVSQCPGSYATPGCDYSGQYYFGRGYVQLSWCYNYRPASLEIFGDDRLVRDPDMVAREEAVAWDTAFWYWKHNVHSVAGVAEGRFGVTTRAINGALECQGANRDKAEARYRIYGNVRTAFGLQGPGIENGCYN